jgi:hypothetical protein
MKQAMSKAQSLKAKVLQLQVLIVLAVVATGAPQAFAQTTNAPGRLTFDAFRTISDRNIFNPNRVARGSGRPAARPTTSAPAARVESFSLVGIMAYEKGPFAFFDGTKSDYKKALQTGETIGDYHVLHLTASEVKLASGTNTFDLKVGMQMRREDEGDWFLSEGGEAPRRRLVSTRTRTRGGATGESTTNSGFEEMLNGSEPEIIVLEADAANGVSPGENLNNGPENGAAAAAADTEAGDNGVTDPVLRAMMERRQRALNQ